MPIDDVGIAYLGAVGHGGANAGGHSKTQRGAISQKKTECPLPVQNRRKPSISRQASEAERGVSK